MLSDTHLTALMSAELAPPRVLFVGNSMIVDNNLPALVSRVAANDGVGLGVATAAANGARLIETLRIRQFRELLSSVPWDVVVLQDFTKTPLRPTDRWASTIAVRRIAALSASPIVLYPPFPASAGNSVYRSAGRLTATPADPRDYARRTMTHYASLAERPGVHLAPVPVRWLENATSAFYANDGHHPSEEGSAFIAGVLWPVIKAVLPPNDPDVSSTSG